jgi:polyisoprenoid-binding protein YceI
MKKTILFAALLLSVASLLQAQVLKTKDGVIYFNPNKDQKNTEYSAQTKEATGVLDADKGTVALLVGMKTFHFNNALLEEHFNENYLHTNKFPNATYKGSLTGFNKDMLQKDGVYNLSSSGTVTMHGQSKPFNAPVILTIKGGTAVFKCVFNIKAKDHDIEIPALVQGKLLEATPLEATISFKTK